MSNQHKNDKEFNEQFIKEWNEAVNAIKANWERAKRANIQTIIRTSSGYSRRPVDKS